MLLVFDICLHHVKLSHCTCMIQSLIDILMSFGKVLVLLRVMLGQKVETPNIFRRRYNDCSIRIDIFLQWGFILVKNCFDLMVFSSFIKNLNFSIQANQILLVVRLGKDTKFFLEFFTVLNTSKFKNSSHFGFKFFVCSGTGLSFC